MLRDFDNLSVRLCLGRCTYRAVGSTCTAVDAGALVDNIRCTLGDRLDRAVACANAASDAVIRNLICHSVTSFFRNNIYKRSITPAGSKVNKL